MVQREDEVRNRVNGNKHMNIREETCRDYPGHDQNGHEPRNIINLTVCNWVWEGRDIGEMEVEEGKERRERRKTKVTSHIRLK